MSEYKIEKGISIPAGRGRRTQYPFNDMEIGDSFFVKLTENYKSIASLRNSVYSSVRHYIQKNKSTKRFRVSEQTVTRTKDYDNSTEQVKGIRVWRIK